MSATSTAALHTILNKSPADLVAKNIAFAIAVKLYASGQLRFRTYGHSNIA